MEMESKKVSIAPDSFKESLLHERSGEIIVEAGQSLLD